MIEPAGRWLQFFYATTNGPRISYITASDGRTVQYYYTTISPGGTPYVALSSVVYYGNASWTGRYTYRASNVPPASGLPLLWTADDPMYPGPMRRIAYTYKTGTNPDGTAAVYGQILSENYWDGVAGHEANGAAVSTLTVGATNNPNIRTETRGDGATRTFIYNGAGYITWASDFMGHQSSQTYDDKKYINSVTDFNRNPSTDFTRNALNGNMTVTTFPLTVGDTPGQTQRPTIQYTYGWASCADPNNRDANNPYYVCTAKDEGGNVTQFLRDTNKRVTRINYPDGGYETFGYNSFGQVLTHRMTTGGTETFTYDPSNGRKLTYRNPSNPTPGNPTASYQYDNRGRISGVTDVLGKTTNLTYNDRGQLTVTTLPLDPVDGQRHTITNAYNPDGTLQSKTNELGYVTNYTYDDYGRVKSVTPPVRGGGDNSAHPTQFYYGANSWDNINDYKYTDSSVTYVTLPSGKKINTHYDANRRKDFVKVAPGTTDEATTEYGYDNVGNVILVTDPMGHWTATIYDERNRPSSVTQQGSRTTEFTYDLAGRKKSVTRPNGQVITYEVYDEMNRLKQQRVKQTPDPDAVTKYTYYPSGLLYTMQDPRLVATNSSYKYTYEYDTSGRKKKVTYPPDSLNVQRTEELTYDTSGRLQTFKNRGSKIQTFSYDALNRMTGFSWNDGLTPSVTFGYDAGSRLITINNANATISRLYFNDNLLRYETQTPTGGVARTVGYTYDGDGNRDTLLIPGYTFQYLYSGRNQPKYILDNANGNVMAYYDYDLDGKLAYRSVNTIPATWTDYTYDGLDQLTWVNHSFNGTGRWFNYGYDAQSGNRKWTKRWNGQATLGEVFGYDLADQATAVKLNIPNPDTTAPGAQTIFYDANGNRTTFRPYGPTDTYYINNNSLNQYNKRNTINAYYDLKGNFTNGFDGSNYQYDAQNRLTTASKAGVTYEFKYDGLNRQVSRTVSGAGGGTTYSVWDGWDLVEEYRMPGPAVQARYLYGPSGLVKNLVTNNYYYQDGSGSTSHLASSSGTILEWYRYDLQGTPVFNDNPQQTASNFGVRHLSTGQQWYSELGLYDLRNRFYSPDIGRFLQPDPIGFGGDATNLYRYCGNNPVTRSDAMGLNVELGLRLGSVPHFFWGVTDPTSSPPTYTRWFDFVPTGSPFGSPGKWYQSPTRPEGYIHIGNDLVTTVQQDLVIRAAFWDAYNANPQAWYEVASNNCIQCGGRIIRDALGEQYTGFNPLNPLTGDIYNAQGKWFGWEDPYTGNLYDRNGNWAGWDPNWKSSFTLTPGKTYPDGSGGYFHMGTTGNIYSGPAPSIAPHLNITSNGGGDWTGLSLGWAAFPGGQAGEGSSGGATGLHMFRPPIQR